MRSRKKGDIENETALRRQSTPEIIQELLGGGQLMNVPSNSEARLPIVSFEAERGEMQTVAEPPDSSDAYVYGVYLAEPPTMRVYVLNVIEPLHKDELNLQSHR